MTRQDGIRSIRTAGTCMPTLQGIVLSLLILAHTCTAFGPTAFSHFTAHSSRLHSLSRTSRSSRRSATRKCSQLRMMDEIQCDVLIVGGGPAGVTCAMYTSRAQHKTIILDKSPTAGALAITHTIANYPGVDPTISGQKLLDDMRAQAVLYGSEYCRGQVFMMDVLENDSEDGEAEDMYNKVVYTPDATYKARALVLATGAMGRKPSFKGEEKYLGMGVSYCATCDGAFYQGSEVCVVGNSAEALEEAEFLTKFASTVHWITKVDTDENNVHAKELLAHENVKHWSKTRLLSIDGDDAGVTGVTLMPPEGETENIVLPVEGAFIYEAGSKPITDFIGDKLEYKKDGGVVVNDEMTTSIDGVFGIGDIRNTPFKQVVVAASDGCIAAMSIDRYLKGRKTVRVDWIHS